MVYMYYGFFLFLLYMTAPLWLFLLVAAGSWWAMRSSFTLQRNMKFSLTKMGLRNPRTPELSGELHVANQKAWVERRKFERVPTTLKVTYQVLEGGQGKGNTLPTDHPTAAALVPLEHAQTVGEGETQDLSEGGLSITSEIPFTVGQQVKISLQFPESKASALLLAEVRSCRAFFKPGKSMYKAGLKIVSVDLEDMAELTGYLFDERPHKRAS